MKSSSMIPNQFLKLILFTILALSSINHLVSSEQNIVAYNDTRQSSNQTQALSCELAPTRNHLSISRSNNNHAKIITDREGDLESSAASASIVQMGPANKQTNQNNLNQDQEVSPSMTSVHQVWTSSSSGNIGELSPEIISKLRNDVPFLAAYAMRPRLVGASSSNNKLDTNNQPVETYVGQLQAPAKAEKTLLQVQASSPPATKSLIQKLGDFNEFNVETSSTSKSEHHHKRKTTLKKKPSNNDELKKRTLDNTTGKLVKGGVGSSNKPTKKNKKQSSKAGKTNMRVRKRSRSRSGSRKSRGKLSGSNLPQHMNIIKHGRYYQEQSFKPNDNANSTDMVVDSKSVGDQTTMIVRGTKNSIDGDVKGGSSDEKKPPTVDMDQPIDDASRSVEKGSDIYNLDRSRPKDGQDTEAGDEVEEGALEESFEPPRRVGDDDVEEDGDTVTVMPKSDGVDDDPEFPPGAPEEDQNGPNDQGDRDGKREREDDSGVGERDSGIPEGDPRGRRVDRERPNPPDSQPSDSSDDNKERDITAGGGIGATTGGGGSSSSGSTDRNTDSSSGTEDDDGGSLDQDDSRNPSGGRNGEAPVDDDGTMSYHEEAGGDSNTGRKFNGRSDDDNNRFDGGLNDLNGVSKADSGTDLNSRKPASSGEPGSEFDSRRSRPGDRYDKKKNNNNNSDENENKFGGNQNKPLCPEDGSICSEGRSVEGGDVDYRDEMSEAALGRKNGNNGTEVEANEDEQGVERKKKHGREEKDCDDHHKDGHYDHHEHDHHDHHDSIKWLQDAIPGEPGPDYPILSRINLSDFNCKDQKYPGYYADVQSRCQVFHICQADGRHDSFLCPNGTIFSQISTVCVWWNSIDCEDAPKYYERNSLLYKSPKSSSNANIPIDDLKPLDGARINPKDMALTSALDEEDETSSIDGLIRAMRRKENSGTESGVSYYGPRIKEGAMDTEIRGLAEHDEASVQRKSTNIEADSGLSSGTSSRLRRNKGRESRRKRRSSTRQAPPKLKSRRVSRNSRRRKLRHGIKPKRRA